MLTFIHSLFQQSLEGGYLGDSLSPFPPNISINLIYFLKLSESTVSPGAPSSTATTPKLEKKKLKKSAKMRSEWSLMLSKMRNSKWRGARFLAFYFYTRCFNSFQKVCCRLPPNTKMLPKSAVLFTRIVFATTVPLAVRDNSENEHYGGTDKSNFQSRARRTATETESWRQRWGMRVVSEFAFQ